MHDMTLQILQHLRYRYIILANCQDPESVVYKKCYESALPDMIYHSPREINKHLSFVQEDLVTFEVPTEVVEAVIFEAPTDVSVQPAADVYTAKVEIEQSPCSAVICTPIVCEVDTVVVEAKDSCDVELTSTSPVYVFDDLIPDVDLPVSDSDLDSCYSSDCERQHDEMGHHLLPSPELDALLLRRRVRNLETFNEIQARTAAFYSDIDYSGFSTTGENEHNVLADEIRADYKALKARPLDKYMSEFIGRNVYCDDPVMSGMSEWEHSIGMRHWLFTVAQSELNAVGMA